MLISLRKHARCVAVDLLYLLLSSAQFHRALVSTCHSGCQFKRPFCWSSARAVISLLPPIDEQHTRQYRSATAITHIPVRYARRDRVQYRTSGIGRRRFCRTLLPIFECTSVTVRTSLLAKVVAIVSYVCRIIHSCTRVVVRYACWYVTLR